MNQGWLRGETIWHILSILLAFVVHFLVALFFWEVVMSLGQLAGLDRQYPFFRTGALYGLNRFEVAGLCVLVPAMLVSVSPFMELLLVFVNGGWFPKPEEKVYMKSLLSELCRRAGEEPRDFKMYVASDMINAFAIGSNRITIGKPLLKGMPRSSLMGILAHEMGHLHYGHGRMGVLLYGMGFFTSVAQMGFRLLWVGTKVLNFLCRLVSWIPILNLLALFINLFAQLYMLIIDAGLIILHYCVSLPHDFLALWGARLDEYEADRYACELGLGQELIDGLSWLDGGEKSGFFANLLSDHPDTHRRIKRMKRWMDEKKGGQ